MSRLSPSSPLLLDGREHQRERKLLMPPFHSERIRSYGVIIQETTDKLIREWIPGRSFPVHPFMQSITLEVIIRVVLGVQEGERVAEFKQALMDLLTVSSSPTILFVFGIFGDRLKTWPRWRRPGLYNRYLQLLEETDRLLFQTIRRGRQNSEPSKDILSVLTHARDEDGRALNDADLRDEMMTLLTAGHETTATALSWALWHLANRTDIQSRAAGEVRESFENGESDPDKIARLPFLEAVIKETMRLNPVIPLVGRSLQAPMRIGARQLPASVVVAPCVYLAHRNPEIWNEPECFHPERFLEQRAKPHEYFPFGGGVRYCLGAGFAMYEMKIVLARILSRFQIEPVPNYRPRILRRGVTLAPTRGVPVRVLPRRRAPE